MSKKTSEPTWKGLAAPVSDQSQNVLSEYAQYVGDKIDLGEVPLHFDEWASIELEENSITSKEIKFL